MEDSQPPTVDDLPSSDGDAHDVAGIERYKLGVVIGRGGMGEVLAAHDAQIGRTVAIKRLRGDAIPDDVATKRFVREARVQGRLEHPAIVPVHEVSRDSYGRPYFVMKQVTGVTLASVLKEGAPPPFTRQRLLRAFVDACLAIEFAHSRGVVHRDLKPSNIMLGDFGETYVLDWGLARLGDSEPDPPTPPIDDATIVTAAGMLVGTPGYISPEQLRGDVPLDGRADVYALGCMLFEILTCERMLDVTAEEAALALAPRDSRPSIRTPHREIPPELDLVCVRATAIERGERFPTARELANAVQSYLDGDRDLALRQRLARDELDAAHEALAADGPASRPDAIRAAARALALDPSAKDAAELVARLMLEPPSEPPPEVTAELARRDIDDLRFEARYGLTAGLVYLAFLPLLYWVGFREPWLYAGFVSAAAVITYAELAIVRHDPRLSGRIALVCHLILLGLLSMVSSPYVIGPGPACVIIMVIATQPAVASTWLVALGALLVTIAPLLLERFGVIPTLLEASGSHLELRLMASSLDPYACAITLTCYCAAAIMLATSMARSQDDEHRRTRTALAIQSWQLRQLLPSTRRPSED